MNNPIIQTDIADLLQEIKSDQKEIRADIKEVLKEVNDLKLEQARTQGKIDALDEKFSGETKSLNTKVDGGDLRNGTLRCQTLRTYGQFLTFLFLFLVLMG